MIDSVAAVSLCQWAVPPPLLKILRFFDCFPNTLEHFSLAPYFNTSTCTIVNIHSRRGYNVKSPIMSNRPYLNTSCRSNIVKSPPKPGIARTGGGGGGGGGCACGIDKCKQYDGLGMKPMRPHCVKYVVLLNCVSLCTLLSLCHYVSSDVRKMWLCVICM